jgi:hypothetical protein
MRGWWLAVALVMAVADCGGSSTTKTIPDPFIPTTTAKKLDLTVTVVAKQDVPRGTGNDCSGTGSLSSLTSGARLTVKDQAGKVLGATSLGSGTSFFSDTDTAFPGLKANYCRFAATVTGLPDADFYQIEVANQSAQSFSRADAADGAVELDFSG